MQTIRITYSFSLENLKVQYVPNWTRARSLSRAHLNPIFHGTTNSSQAIKVSKNP